MRAVDPVLVQLYQDARAAEFSTFLLTVGSGELPIIREIGEDVINVPEQTRSPAASVAELADRIYPNLADNYQDTDWLHQRDILTTRNADAEVVNNTLIDLLPGAARQYHSVDTMTDPDAVPVPTEVLNSIELSGMPSHILTLKVSQGL